MSALHDLVHRLTDAFLVNDQGTSTNMEIRELLAASRDEQAHEVVHVDTVHDDFDPDQVPEEQLDALTAPDTVVSDTTEGDRL